MPRLSMIRLAVAFLAATIARGQVDRVSYTVEYRKDVLDRAFVTATLAGKPDGTALEIQIPTWSPGAYEIKPYYKRILAMSARDAMGTVLELAKENDLTWKLPASTEWPISSGPA